MAFFVRLLKGVIDWLLRRWDTNLSSSDIEELQAAEGPVQELSAAIGVLGRIRADHRFNEAISRVEKYEGGTVGLLELYRMVKPPSLVWFAQHLEDARPSNTGGAEVSTAFRVTDPDNPLNYKDFYWFDEIPDEIRSESGQVFRTRLDRVKVVATVTAQGSSYATARY